MSGASVAPIGAVRGASVVNIGASVSATGLLLGADVSGSPMSSSGMLGAALSREPGAVVGALLVVVVEFATDGADGSEVLSVVIGEGDIDGLIMKVPLTSVPSRLLQ